MKTFLTLLLISCCSVFAFGQTEHLTISLNDSVSLKLTKESFNKENRDIVYWDSRALAISSIDGKPFFGTDATLPITELTSAKLMINNQSITLETSGMFNPWEEDGSDMIKCKLKKFAGNPMRIRCLFSSGAGRYLVEWTIVGNQAYRTILTYDKRMIRIVELEK